MTSRLLPAWLSLLALACLPAHADVPPINQGTLTLVDEAGFNQLTLSLAVSGFGSDSDTSTITGSLLTRLDIDPATGRSPEFTILGGNLQGTPVSLQIKVLFVTVVDVSSTTIGGTVATITPPGTIDPLTGAKTDSFQQIRIYANSHYVTPRPTLQQATKSIRIELAQRLKQLHDEGKLLEAQRLEQRTNFDLEMLEATGVCNGIEN